MNGGSSSRSSFPATALMALLVLTSCVLAFMTIRLSGDVSDLRKQSATEQDLQAVSDRLASIEEVTVAQAPAVARMADDVRKLRAEVFGATGSGFLSGGIDDLQRSIDELERTVQILDTRIGSLRSCVNQFGSQLSSASRFLVPSC